MSFKGHCRQKTGVVKIEFVRKVSKWTQGFLFFTGLMLVVCWGAQAVDLPENGFSWQTDLNSQTIQLAQAQDEDSSDLALKYYQEARIKYSKEKNYQQAKQLLLESLKHDPENKSALRLLEKTEKKIIQGDNKKEETRLKLIAEQEKTERAAQAKKEAKAKKVKEKQTSDLLKAANKDLKDDQYDEAINKFQGVLAMDAGNKAATKGISKAEKAKSETLLKAKMAKEEAAAKSREEQRIATEKKNKEAIDSAFSSAYSDYKAKDYKKAIAGFDSVLVLKPDHSKAISYKGKSQKALMAKKKKDTLLKEKQEKEAQVAKEKALQIKQENEEKARLLEQKTQKAMLAKKIDSLLDAANSALRAKEYEAAIAGYESVLNLDPGNKSAISKMKKASKSLSAKLAKEEIAKAEAEEQAKKSAEKAEMEALEQKIDALLAQAKETYSIGDLGSAKTSYEGVLNLDPGNKTALKGIKNVKKSSEAQAEKQRLAAEEQKKIEEKIAIQAKQDQIDEQVDLGKSAYKAKDYVTAKTCLEQALALDTSNRVAKSYLKKTEKALAKLEAKKAEVVEVPAPEVPEVEEVPVVEAPVMEMEEVIEISELDQQRANDQVKMGDTFFSYGFLDESEKYYQESLKIISGFEAAMKGLEKVEEERASILAKSEAEKAADMKEEKSGNEKKADSLFQEGRDLYSQGDILGSVDLWKQALDLSPDHKESQAYIQETLEEYQKALGEKMEAEAIASEEARLEKLLKEPAPQQMEFDDDIAKILNTLSIVSGFNIIAKEGVEGRITINLRNKTLEEVFNAILTNNGFIWERIGADIYVKPNFRTKIYPLDTDEYVKIERILEDPENLEDPTTSLYNILYGDRGVPTVAGKVMNLNRKTSSLIVTDTPENLIKVEAFLKQIPALAKLDQPLITRIFPLDPDAAENLYKIVELLLYEEEGQEGRGIEGRKLLFERDSNTMIVKDTDENIKRVEEVLKDEKLAERLAKKELIAKRFKVTDEEPTTAAAQLRIAETVDNIHAILKVMLFGGPQGLEESVRQGRRLVVPDNIELKSKGYIDVVETPANIKKVERYLASVRGEESLIRAVRVNHADPTSLRNQLLFTLGLAQQNQGQGGVTTTQQQTFNVPINVVADPSSHNLIIFGYGGGPEVQRIVEQVENIVPLLDVPPEQVEIEARLIEVTLDDLKKTGFDWQLTDIQPGGLELDNWDQIDLDTAALGGILEEGGSQISFNVLGETKLRVVMDMIRRSGNAEILSAPKITVISAPEEPATIEILTEEPYIDSIEQNVNTQSNIVTITPNFDVEEVGISLEVSPTVQGDGYIILDLAPEISSIVGRIPVTVGGGDDGINTATASLGRLVISTRSADTRIRIKNGDTIVIGGLIRDELREENSKVPFFGDIPLLGGMFRDVSYEKIKTSLLIFVTVRIVDN